MSIDLKGSVETQPLYDALLDEISYGRLVAGQRLKVSQLAKQFGVSASPVREALRQLQGEGIVEIHPNRGATIKRADASTIQNTFEVLQLLEPYFVSWFAENAPAKDVDRLVALQEEIRKAATGDLVKFRKLDSKFHGLICEKHYNYVAADTWKRLRIALIAHAAPLPISPMRIKLILAEHDALIESFRENDVVKADKVIRQHVDGSFVQMSQQMRALGL